MAVVTPMVTPMVTMVATPVMPAMVMATVMTLVMTTMMAAVMTTMMTAVMRHYCISFLSTSTREVSAISRYRTRRCTTVFRQPPLLSIFPTYAFTKNVGVLIKE
jgi:hypothetical protein